MLIRIVEATPPIERVTEVERDARAAEHDKQGESHRRVTRQQAHKEMTDQWCGSGAGGEEKPPQEEQPEQQETPQPKRQGLDYRA